MASEHSADPSPQDLERLDQLYHKLRGLINALGLCVRVLESGPPPREMDEYAQLIAETSEQIEELVEKVGLRDRKP